MSTVLVLGASGQIGRFLLPQLLDAGYQVLALSRHSPASDSRVRWLQGDLYAHMPELPALDAIFSLGPLDGLARWLPQTSFAHAPRLIAFSSMSAISKVDSADAAERALAARLLVSEQAVIAAAGQRGMAWTVLRPTLIYGAGMDRSLTPLVRFASRWRVFPRIPAATGLRQPVHAQDLAGITLRALEDSGRGHGQIFALGGGERLSFACMLARVQASLPSASLALPIPLFALRSAAALARFGPGLPAPSAAALQRLRLDLLADNEPARLALDWAPRGFAPQMDTWQQQRL